MPSACGGEKLLVLFEGAERIIVTMVMSKLHICKGLTKHGSLHAKPSTAAIFRDKSSQ
jgi:hypothetical protein